MSGFLIDLFPSRLGGGIPGAQPIGGLIGGGGGSLGGSGMDWGSARGRDRLVLRKSRRPPNGKYVYDSSDYITYLKQKAVNKNYNDLSNGGDDFKASQSAQRAIRRY